MPITPLFEGLVFDEDDQIVDVVYVGSDPCYVVDDSGFKRHIPTEQVDRQVLEQMKSIIEGHEDLLSEQAAKILGQDDIFTKAMIESQLKNVDDQFEQLLNTGIPEESRAYMGMTGFKIIINHHGDVLEVEQPSGIEGDE